MSEQYTHIELLFAMEVRQAASSLRRQSIPAELRDSDDLDAESRIHEWMKAHPISDYVAPVVSEVVGTAGTIRRLLEAK